MTVGQFIAIQQLVIIKNYLYGETGYYMTENTGSC
jgi:hypothetical protein